MNKQSHITGHRFWGLGLAAFAAVSFLPADASAQSIERFYKVKGLRVVVGSGAGGGFDTYTRAFARHYGRYIAGNPRVVVQNMPGASSLRATNFVFNKAPRDGSLILSNNNAMMDEHLLGNPKVKFDIREFEWLGSIGKQHSICVTWHTSPIKKIQQIIGKKMNVSATGATGSSATLPRVLNQILGTKFKVIMGYSTGGSRLALERGEVDAICGLSYTTLIASNRDWFDKKLVNVIAQVGLRDHPDLKGVPNVLNLLKSADDRKVFEFNSIPQEMGRPYAAPPHTEPAKVAVLRKAFNETMKDPKFLADMAKLKLSVDPLTAAEMDKLIAKMYSYPKSLLERVANLIGRAKKEKLGKCATFTKNSKQCRKRKKKKKK